MPIYLQQSLGFMMKCFSLAIFIFLVSSKAIAQDNLLPKLSVKSIGNRVIVSWKQDYKKIITTLNIQRSFDSTKNFKTIGEVLSPQSIENGYIDANPPYNRMYYRVFVAFDGGSYVYSKTYRAVKDTSIKRDSAGIQFPITGANADLPWLKINPKDIMVELDGKPKITYPSQTVFTLKDNNIFISLQNTSTIKYSIRFYDDFDKFLFEIKKVKEDNFVIEKVNFGHSGWYKFELFENGELIEKNKFQILKPIKGL